jgi:hypothetical protein
VREHTDLQEAFRDARRRRFAADDKQDETAVVTRSARRVEHSGSDSGAHAQVFFVPYKHVGAVIFTNGENGYKVIGEIVRVLYPDPVYAKTVSN